MKRAKSHSRSKPPRSSKQTRDSDSMADTRVVWRPTQHDIAHSNLKRFMDRFGIQSLEELAQRSSDDVAWFWDAVLQDLDIRFYKPYSQLVDLSRGIPWPRWCVGGEMN